MKPLPIKPNLIAAVMVIARRTESLNSGKWKYRVLAQEFQI
jgi:hypothetical protein